MEAEKLKRINAIKWLHDLTRCGILLSKKFVVQAESGAIATSEVVEFSTANPGMTVGYAEAIANELVAHFKYGRPIPKEVAAPVEPPETAEPEGREIWERAVLAAITAEGIADEVAFADHIRAAWIERFRRPRKSPSNPL